MFKKIHTFFPLNSSFFLSLLFSRTYFFFRQPFPSSSYVLMGFPFLDNYFFVYLSVRKFFLPSFLNPQTGFRPVKVKWVVVTRKFCVKYNRDSPLNVKCIDVRSLLVLLPPYRERINSNPGYAHFSIKVLEVLCCITETKRRVICLGLPM